MGRTSLRRPLGRWNREVLGLLLFLALLLSLTAAFATGAAADPATIVTLVEKNSTWKYNDSNTDLGTAWRAEGYDDSVWKTGKSPLGYPAGDNNSTFGAISAGTLVANASNPNAYITYYFRKSFELTSVASITKLDLTVGLDDGYVMYINGTEVRRTYMPGGEIGWQTFANYVNEPSSTQGTDAADITGVALPLLKAGTNTIAVEMHNRDANSSDIYFDMQLLASAAEGADETYSVTAGVKSTIDDSEEFVTNSDSLKIGDVDDGSSDLEICKEKPGSANENNQIIAVRFADLGIPHGATITSAYIQFTGDQDGDAVTKSVNPFSVNIYADDTANSAPIQDVPYNISSRSKTADLVVWSLDGDDSKWAILESATKERTPDLTDLVQQLVDKGGWSFGNAMTFLLTGNSGCRAAVSSEDGSHGPVLQVTFTYAGDLLPAPTGLAGVAPTTAGGSDGQITGATTAMEYKLSGGSTWTACTGTTIMGLAAGVYDVRYAASGGSSAGPSTVVTVPEFVEIKVTSIVVGVGASETERTFTWYSSSDEAGELQLALASAMTGTDFPATHQTFAATKASSSLTGFSTYKATVSGLASDADYVYRIGNADAWSEVHDLSTQDFDDASFSFLFAGDPQIGSSGNVTNDTNGWTTTLNKAEQWFPNADFLVSLGDQVEHATNETEYTGYLAPDVLRSLTLANNIGNHDSGGVNFKQHFTVPNASETLGVTTAGGDYWWSYEGVLFMAINSNDMSTAEHKTFLEGAIAAHKVQNGGEDPLWKVVTFHHSVYSTASHTTDNDILQRRNDLPVVFEELGIDAVLMGHDHVYTRSLMMNGTIPVTMGYKADGANQYASYTDDPEINETVYLTGNSASGSKFYAIQNLSFPFLAMDNQESTPNLSKVDVTAGSLTFTTYRTGAANGVGDVVDTFTLERDPLLKQDAPTGLAGVAPTSIANSDGKITGVGEGMEYKLSTDAAYASVLGSEVTGLVPGTYHIRYAAKEGYHESDPVEVTVPAYDGFAVNIGVEQKSGSTYKRLISAQESGALSLEGKFLVIRFTEKAGWNARNWSMVIPADVRETTVWYYAQGTKVEVWLTGGVPSQVGENMDVEVFEYTKSDVPVRAVFLSSLSLKLYTGQKQVLTASVLPLDASNKAVSWSSGNQAVATVDENGLVTAVAPGSAVITVTTQDGGKTAKCSVTVKAPVSVTGVKLTQKEITIRVGQWGGLLDAVVSPSNATNKNLIWSSSNNSVVSVDQHGKYTGLKVGTATITVTTEDGGKTATCKINVVKTR